MDCLYKTYIMDQEYLSDAFVYSLIPIKKSYVKHLVHAQEIVEAMWLGEFPMIAILTDKKEKDAETSVHLYDDIRLLLPEGWKIIDDADTILVNDRMQALCQLPDPPYADLELIGSSNGLKSLNKSHVFVVCTV